MLSTVVGHTPRPLLDRPKPQSFRNETQALEGNFKTMVWFITNKYWTQVRCGHNPRFTSTFSMSRSDACGVQCYVVHMQARDHSCQPPSKRQESDMLWITKITWLHRDA